MFDASGTFCRPSRPVSSCFHQEGAFQVARLLTTSGPTNVAMRHAAKRNGPERIAQAVHHESSVPQDKILLAVDARLNRTYVRSSRST